MGSPSFCLSCPDREGCKKICERLEKYLKGLQAKDGYSDRHRRRKELLWDAQKIEQLATKRAFRLKYNWDIKMKDNE